MSTNENAKVIWNFLKGKGLNDYAIAGVMCNLKAESALNPKNLQNTYKKKLGFTDETYTAAVDDGSYDNFAKDKAGYGLAQWTYWSRKQNLLKFAKAAHVSIGDLQMQLDFFWEELQGYKSVMSTLAVATSVREASDAVMLNYERPANQSETAKQKRAAYGQTFFDKYGAGAGKEEPVVAAPAKEKEHTVRAGDTLWGIAKKYLDSGLKWKQIAEYNGIKGTLIRVGQVLKIPE